MAREKKITSHAASEHAPPQVWKDELSVLQSYFAILSVVHFF